MSESEAQNSGIGVSEHVYVCNTTTISQFSPKIKVSRSFDLSIFVLGDLSCSERWTYKTPLSSFSGLHLLHVSY